MSDIVEQILDTLQEAKDILHSSEKLYRKHMYNARKGGVQSEK